MHLRRLRTCVVPSLRTHRLTHLGQAPHFLRRHATVGLRELPDASRERHFLRVNPAIGPPPSSARALRRCPLVPPFSGSTLSRGTAAEALQPRVASARRAPRSLSPLAAMPLRGLGPHPTHRLDVAPSMPVPRRMRRSVSTSAMRFASHRQRPSPAQPMSRVELPSFKQPRFTILPTP